MYNLALGLLILSIFLLILVIGMTANILISIYLNRYTSAYNEYSYCDSSTSYANITNVLQNCQSDDCNFVFAVNIFNVDGKEVHQLDGEYIVDASYQTAINEHLIAAYESKALVKIYKSCTTWNIMYDIEYSFDEIYRRNPLIVRFATDLFLICSWITWIVICSSFLIFGCITVASSSMDIIDVMRNNIGRDKQEQEDKQEEVNMTK
jgi:hypothetical protein